METFEHVVDVLVIGGGTAGPMAAVKAKQANPELNVLLLEKANVKRSGAISMGMDGLNNAVVPGFATPEQYVREITIANDGIVDQKEAERDGKEIEECVNAGEANDDLQQNNRAAPEQTQPAWQPDKEAARDFYDKDESGREMLEPLG